LDFSAPLAECYEYITRRNDIVTRRGAPVTGSNMMGVVVK
jgi:hypothetical protein